MAVRTDVRLDRPAAPILYTPPATLHVTESLPTNADFESALEFLAFPIIEVVEYMPEKGVQFPDPDDIIEQEIPESVEPASSVPARAFFGEFQNH